MSTDTDVVIDEIIKQSVRAPADYSVIMLNDDATPMDWVIGVLKEIFKHNDAQAEVLTLKIHEEGLAVVGTYKYEIAEQKTLEAVNTSRENGFPLKVKMVES